ncbi:MAG: ABC transporter ATP-binding protein [Actinobacteria bacterium]|nr:ABC transporter ATP-binding protein [Actinomycetota bacterium]
MVLGSIRELIRSDRGRPAIVVDGLTESFRLYHERPSGLKERLYRFSKPSFTDFNALEDVSFTIEHGETVGIIGHNGSGKSTLLKVLARILPPDEGHVEINGRLASLLELGAGFHGDLSGRENIYLNGAILGLTRSEIDERFDDIVDFAGVRPFLDTAVRNYSSGMYVRLGFAIAVNVDPDVLLVDEVLSVGDAQFQARSLERMQRFQSRGKTVVIVSHDLGAIQELCDRTIVLDRGRVAFDGHAKEGVQLYAQLMGTARGDDEQPDTHQLGTGRAWIDEVQLLDGSGSPAEQIGPSTQLLLRVRFEAREPIDACSAGALVSTGSGDHLYEVHTTWQGLGVGPLLPGQSAVVDIRFTAHVLAGHYRITPMITDAVGRTQYAVLPDAVAFEVRPAPGGSGLVDMVAATSVSEGPALRLGVESPTGPLPIVRLEDLDTEGGDAAAAGGR